MQLEYKKDISTLYPYTEIINEIQMPSATKISLDLIGAWFDSSSNILSTHILSFSSLSLRDSKLSHVTAADSETTNVYRLIFIGLSL